MGRGRNIDSGANPFRERNPANAEKRRALIQNGRGKLTEMQKRLNERAQANRRFK